jgi:hypothetical protein
LASIQKIERLRFPATSFCWGGYSPADPADLATTDIPASRPSIERVPIYEQRDNADSGRRTSRSSIRQNDIRARS